VAAQVLVPMAATLAAPGTSGRAVGLVMSGLLIGILASRSVAGVLSGLGGWSTVYGVGAGHLAMAVLLARALPRAPVVRSAMAKSASLGQLCASTRACAAGR
jgi:predicted MFS family arabinose efflux permease